MMAVSLDRRLIERLPPVRGRITEGARLANAMWFRVGGPAEILFEPADADDLATFLRGRPRNVPVTVLGVGSNVLVRDGGIAGVVVRLGRPFAEIACAGTDIRTGAGAMDATVARACRDAGIAGLEFLSGIPGTLGGALRMNAGAYDGEIGDVIVSAAALDPEGARHELDPDALGYGYRSCAVPPGWIFVAAHLRGRRDTRAAIAARMARIAAARQETQPVRSRSGGCTFKNPPDEAAWALIDRAGCRGLRIGAAQISELHANFLINTGGAGAAELESLGEEIRRRVEDRTGVVLEWEIERLGEAARRGGHG